MRSVAKPLIVIVLCAALAAFLYSLYRTRTPGTASEEIKTGNPATPESSPSSTTIDPRYGVSPSSPTAPGAGVGAPTGTPPPFASSAPRPPTTPFLLGSADTPPPMDPATVLNNMRNVIANYGSRYGGNPVGENVDITAALNGDNPNGAKFISEVSGLRINGQGELVDYWGTPFFFHQVSGKEMEIRSAGPDRRMWTADDLVTK